MQLCSVRAVVTGLGLLLPTCSQSSVEWYCGAHRYYLFKCQHRGELNIVNTANGNHSRGSTFWWRVNGARGTACVLVRDLIDCRFSQNEFAINACFVRKRQDNDDVLWWHLNWYLQRSTNTNNNDKNNKAWRLAAKRWKKLCWISSNNSHYVCYKINGRLLTTDIIRMRVAYCVLVVHRTTGPPLGIRTGTKRQGQRFRHVKLLREFV